MFKRTANLSALLLIGGLVAAVAPTAAKANVISRDVNFCEAIGLNPDQQVTCEQQLESATSPQQRHDLQAAWVSRSAVASPGWTGSLYEPAVDANVLNGMPGTAYQSKPGFVSNRTTAAIQRALKADNNPNS